MSTSSDGNSSNLTVRGWKEVEGEGGREGGRGEGGQEGGREGGRELGKEGGREGKRRREGKGKKTEKCCNCHIIEVLQVERNGI